MLCAASEFAHLELIHDVKVDPVKGKGGASRRGCRDETPLLSADTTDLRRWIPPSHIKRDAYTQQDRNDAIFRKVRGILNKLTPEKFEKLSHEILIVGIDSQIILKGIILLIFDKALDEPKYSFMYAQLCRKLCEEAPRFQLDGQQGAGSSTFRRLLLNKCQDEFENRQRATAAFEKGRRLTPDEEEQFYIAKQKMLGNIKFIGELGKLDMLHENILHQCIKQLLEKKKTTRVSEMEEDLECLCQIMRTVGRRLDTDKAKSWMDQYFERIKCYSCHPDLAARIRFMLRDMVDLRESQEWTPRQVTYDHGPKTIQQIREDYAKDYGVYYPPTTGTGRSSGGSAFANLFSPPPRPGMTDAFHMFSSGPSLGGNIGTGPGVIHMNIDSMNGYSTSGMSRSPVRNMNQGYGVNMSMRNNQNNQQQMKSSQQYPPRLQQQLQQQNSQPGMQLSGQTQQKKELPPRFSKKNSPFGQDGEISLRPAQNSMVLKPSAPSMLPKSAMPVTNHVIGPRETSPANQPPPIMMQPQPQISIRIAPEKEKARDKKEREKAPSKAELLKQTRALLGKFIEDKQDEEFIAAFREMKISNKIMPDIVSKMMTSVVDKLNEDREDISELIKKLKEEDLINTSQFTEAFKSLLEEMASLEAEVPLVKSHVARFGALAVTNDLIPLADLSRPMENGAYYPLFLLCLQQIKKIKDEDWLLDRFNKSKINLLHMLPEIDQSKEKLMTVLEDRKLNFLYPMLKVQKDLSNAIMADPNPTPIYKWVKDNVNVLLHTAPNFINVLVTSIIKYVTCETTLCSGVDRSQAPDKQLQEKEKELMTKLKPVLQLFLHNQPSLQLTALYALQVHCYNNSFPKGMLLRLFMYMYDSEIVEEDVFLKWKEDITDEYPGKGKALFQVNQWLTWLEEAEEEDDEGSDGE